MYKRYRASLGAIVWSEIKWNFKRFRMVFPEIIAGVAFFGIILSLPIFAAFIIG